MSELRLRDTDLHWREIDGEVIALEARGSTYVAANGAGTLLWRALVAGARARGSPTSSSRAYGIDRERAAADVDALPRRAGRAGPASRGRHLADRPGRVRTSAPTIAAWQLMTASRSSS